MPGPTSIALTTSDGVRLAGLAWRADGPPGGPTCVVGHGFTGSAGNPWLRAIAGRLTERGFDVVVPDLRGHGRSGGRATAGVEEARDIAAAVRFARDGGAARVATLGWSMGATAVLRNAGAGDPEPDSRPDAVVAVSAPGHWSERGTRAMRIVHWMFRTRTGRATTRVVKHTRIDPGPWPEPPEDLTDTVARIAPVPLLLVHGDADHYFPLHHLDLLAAAAPAAEVWVERGMAHAENATTPELLDRIAGWLWQQWPDERATWSPPAAVCNDERHE